MKRLLALFFLIIALAGCGDVQEGEEKLKPTKIEKLGSIDFNLKSSNPIINQNAEESLVNQRFQNDSDDLLNILQEYYLDNFLNPAALKSDRKKDEKLKFFSQELISGLNEGEKKELSLDVKGATIIRTNLQKSEILELAIFYNKESKPEFSAIDIDIQASFELENGQQADFYSSGRLVFELIDDNWKITGFKLENGVNTQ